MKQSTADWRNGQVETIERSNLFPCTPEGIAKATKLDGTPHPGTNTVRRWEELVDWWPDVEVEDSAHDERRTIYALIIAMANGPNCFEQDVRLQAINKAREYGIAIPHSILPVIIPYSGTEGAADVPACPPKPNDPLRYGV